jgi:hypothetical protein
MHRQQHFTAKHHRQQQAGSFQGSERGQPSNFSDEKCGMCTAPVPLSASVKDERCKFCGLLYCRCG